MNYIDFEKLAQIDTEDFTAVKPYPYVNPEGLLTPEGYQALLENMPDQSLFVQKFGYKRKSGQAPHDRYSLEYTPDTPVSGPWKEFIVELRSDAYRGEIARLLGAKKPEFRFQWHYTPNASDVSPHCDATREHGSHLFYFNSEESWDPAWGGATLALDDGGQLNFKSAPTLDAFDREIELEFMGNVSALMKRTDHSWHAVRGIDCPEDKLRRIFIVVVNPDSLFWKTRDRIVGKKIQRF
jgi:hypothetical protein